MDQNRQVRKEKVDLSPTPYEPPRIERILTPEDLEREVQYAGFNLTGPA